MLPIIIHAFWHPCRGASNHLHWFPEVAPLHPWRPPATVCQPFGLWTAREPFFAREKPTPNVCAKVKRCTATGRYFYFSMRPISGHSEPSQ